MQPALRPRSPWTVSWGGYVRLAFDEIRLAGASEPPVTRRMCAALADLKSVGAITGRTRRG